MPQKFTNFAIIICHEIRQIYKLPLRQCQGFINSIFAIKELPIVCPDYSCLSKRLSALNIPSPRYKNTDKAEIIIPPDSDAIYHIKNHPQRNRNLQEIKTFCRMNWQRVRNYGKRNYAELAIQHLG